MKKKAIHRIGWVMITLPFFIGIFTGAYLLDLDIKEAFIITGIVIGFFVYLGFASYLLSR
jgi:hypothetical protein